jgi:hypothetical protein
VAGEEARVVAAVGLRPPRVEGVEEAADHGAGRERAGAEEQEEEVLEVAGGGPGVPRPPVRRPDLGDRRRQAAERGHQLGLDRVRLGRGRCPRLRPQHVEGRAG